MVLCLRCSSPSSSRRRRAPGIRAPTAQPFLPAKAGGVVVLDLSASITSDTYSRIHESLQELVARGGRYGLVVFSNVAYEALPPGHARPRRSSRSSATSRCRRHAVPGEQPTFPVNPWSDDFTSGTEISEGLDLARSIELAGHVRHPAVVLISDLADDPNDLQRLNTVLNEYQVEKIQLRVISLNADPSDLARFKGLIGTAASIIPAGLAELEQRGRRSRPARASRRRSSCSPSRVALLLAASELRAARLTWGEHREVAS